MSYMRASFLMRKTRYVKTYVKWTELFGNREKATILNRGKSPYTKGVIVVDIVDKALRMGEGRQIKKLENVAKATNALEDEIAALDDEELKGQTAKFKQRIENGESLDKLMPEAFATVREASKRTLGLRHFDVQLMGGAALHWGNIAEMKTGEGKTLVATLPAYLNALDGQGVHVVTVNDYLASYQAELMGRVYRFLGMSTGCIITNQKPPERRKQYNADITYGTNNEFGFDYLRDNMAWEKSDLVQRGHHYAIVDEVDSILIDEARTPLIISGPAEGDVTRWYRQFARLVLKLNRDEDYEVDEKKKVVGILDPGITKVEDYLGIDNLYEPNNTALIGYLNNAIKAKELFLRDRDYVVTGGEVLIVDEHTGRILPGRRYNEGLHQAIEAKEGVEVKAENQTFATITLQNYFRMYHKLAGMTGTAETEAGEFWDIYKLDVVTIPTNRPVARIDMNDRVYKTKKEKYNAVIDEIQKMVEAGRPVLVGTTSVEISELLSRMLQLRRIPHNVLNAKLHQKEAEIVARAGQKAVVTIATNMAGRGTDIKLTPEVKAAGGLAIIGTERHESRRVDRQLRGRAGRQGDPGSSVFFVSFEDTVMRLFATDKVVKMLDRLGLKEGEPIEAGMVTRSIENAQKRVEENNFGIRKRLLEYDDVMNAQRKVIYSRRHHALMGERIGIDIMNMLYETAGNIVKRYGSQSDYEDLRMDVLTTFGFEPSFTEDEYKKMSTDKQVDAIYRQAITTFNQRTEKMAEAAMPVISDIVENHGGKGLVRVPITDGKRVFGITVDLEESYNEGCKNIAKAWQKSILLMSIDEAWKEHLRELDQLRQSVQNASYEQKDPLVIYKIESFKMFDAMLDNMNAKAVASLTRGQIPVQAQSQPPREQQAPAQAEEATETDNSPRIPAPRYSNTSVSPSMPTAEPVAAPERRDDYRKYTAHKEEYPGQDEQRQAARAPQGPHHTDPIKVGPKVGRNDPCPCGSGKKYKNCHGKGLV